MLSTFHQKFVTNLQYFNFLPHNWFKSRGVYVRQIWYADHQLQHNLYLFFSFHLHLTKLSLFMKCSCTQECSVSFIKSFESLQEWRMRMMPHGVHPIIYWESQVVLVQLNQGLTQILRSPKFFGKCISLKLKSSTQNCHKKAYNL